MTKRKMIISAILSLTFSFLVLALSFVCYGWLCAPKKIESGRLQVKTDAPLEITFNVYKYDKNNDQFVTASGTDVSLSAYDSIFMEYNVNLATVLELTMRNVANGTQSISFTLNRTTHNDATINELNQYSSSIVDVSLYATTTQASTAENIWTAATSSATGHSVFTIKTNNVYNKLNSIILTQSLTAEQSAGGTLYIYLVFDYADSLITDYIQQYDIFDSEIGDINSIVTFANDLGVLEVTVS